MKLDVPLNKEELELCIDGLNSFRLAIKHDMEVYHLNRSRLSDMEKRKLEELEKKLEDIKLLRDALMKKIKTLEKRI